jgi:hypothetical protein
MNTVERVGLAGAGRGAAGDPGASVQVRLELLLVGMAVLCAVVGGLTNVFLSAAVTSLGATLVTLWRLRVEVRELEEWAASCAVTTPSQRRSA